MRFIIFCYFIFGFISTLDAQIINVEERRIRAKFDSLHWYGYISLGYNVTKVKETISNFTTDAQLQYKTKRHLVLSLTNYNFVRAGSKSFVNSGYQHLRYNYKIKERLTWELFGQVQNNQIQTMRLRALLGTGLRIRLFRSKNGLSRVYYGSSYMREYNEFKTPTVQRYDRWNNYLSFALRPNTNVFLQNTTYVQPVLGNSAALRWSSETDVEFKVFTKLAFRTSFNWSFDGTVPEGIPKKTYTFQNGLRWTFR